MASPEPTRVYSARAASYACGRPDYPREALAALAARIPAPADVADLGSGTGILTAMLLGLGYRVQAVEPNAAMRGRAEARLAGHAGFTSVSATAEATGIAARSLAAVTVGQALHWFDLPRARSEIGRILRPRGRVLFLWNDLDRDSALGGVLDTMLVSLLPGFADQRERKDLVPEALAQRALPPGTALEGERFAHGQILDAERFRARFVSASYAPHSDPCLMARLERELDSLFRAGARGGVIRLDYVTTAISADLPGDLEDQP